MNTLLDRFGVCANRPPLSRILAAVGLFLLPLKLSLSYLCLIPLILLWILQHRQTLYQHISSNRVFAPFLFFVIALTLSALFGINLGRSLPAAPVLLFYGCLMLVFHDISDRGWYRLFLVSLIAGQTLAALHSVVEGAFPSVPRLFLGKVTESGQLALTLMCALGTATLLSTKTPATQKNRQPLLGVWGVLNTALFTACGFLSSLSPSAELRISLLGLALVTLTLSFRSTWIDLRRFGSTPTDAGDWEHCKCFLYTVAIPLLVSAVLINLKRGPWAGLLCSATVFLFLHARRWLWPVLALSVLCLTLFQPVRERLMESSQDFFIAGGRSVIWEVGTELSTRYPLGIGFRNSPVLQKFSPDIPPELKHFHSNIINILVEAGWISCALFLWWIFSALRAAFAYPLAGKDHVLVFSLGCALLSWQIAGLVEYNVGDSEVLCIALCLMGILSFLSARE